jgi:hypothetical protein
MSCPLCTASDIDKLGNLKHQPWCPHFLRGPDRGGDPLEWPTLLDEALRRIPGVNEIPCATVRLGYQPREGRSANGYSIERR